MKDSKNVVIALLCTVLCVMAVTYAAFSTSLTVTGTATISSTWNVAIESINCTTNKALGGEDIADVSIAPESLQGSLTAELGIVFKQPGDRATCTITIKNSGSLDAYLQAIDITGNEYVEGTDAIKYTVGQGTDDAELNDTLAKSNGTHTYTVVSEFVGLVDAQGNSLEIPEDKKEKTLIVSFNYMQKTTTPEGE